MNFRGVSLKVLLDEMFAGLKEHFEALGYDVVTVQEVGLKSVKDREIVEYAKIHDLLLITQDAKPAEIAELTGVKCVLVTNAMIAKVVDAKIRQYFP
jgi:predicted nuclease of predicted toxin-antitoxin system